MWEFNQCLSYDKALYAVDVAGSKAYALALSKTSPPILTSHELSEIHRGLDQVQQEWENGSFEIKQDDEDIHTANERRLSEIIGKDIGGKLHTGRSRNDQVATDMRLWLVQEVKKDIEWIQGVVGILSVKAEEWIDHLAAGFTHLQVRLLSPSLASRITVLITGYNSARNPSASRTSSSHTPTPSPATSTVSATSSRSLRRRLSPLRNGPANFAAPAAVSLRFPSARAPSLATHSASTASSSAPSWASPRSGATRCRCVSSPSRRCLAFHSTLLERPDACWPSKRSQLTLKHSPTVGRRPRLRRRVPLRVLAPHGAHLAPRRGPHRLLVERVWLGRLRRCVQVRLALRSCPCSSPSASGHSRWQRCSHRSSHRAAPARRSCRRRRTRTRASSSAARAAAPSARCVLPPPASTPPRSSSRTVPCAYGMHSDAGSTSHSSQAS